MSFPSIDNGWGWPPPCPCLLLNAGSCRPDAYEMTSQQWNILLRTVLLKYMEAYHLGIYLVN